MNFLTEETIKNFFLPNRPPPPLGPPPPPPPSDLFNIPKVPALMKFLITMILILTFPAVMYHQHSIHHYLGHLQKKIFQTDHVRLKLHQT